MRPTHNMRAIQNTIADYCRNQIDRASALRILELSGIRKAGAREMLDSADNNLTLKASYLATPKAGA